MRTAELVIAAVILLASYGMMGFQAAFTPGWIGYVTTAAVAVTGFAVGRVLIEMCETGVKINS